MLYRSVDFNFLLPSEMLKTRRAKFECKLMNCSNVLNYFGLGLNVWNVQVTDYVKYSVVKVVKFLSLCYRFLCFRWTKIIIPVHVMICATEHDIGHYTRWTSKPLMPGLKRLCVYHSVRCVPKKVDPKINRCNSTKTCQVCLKFYTCELWNILITSSSAIAKRSRCRVG